MSTDLSRSRVLVTGAGGFIGTAVVAALIEAGADIRALSGPDGPKKKNRRAPVELTTADILDRVALKKALHGIDTVVHLAGPSSVADSYAHPDETRRVHFAGTVGLLEECAAADVRRVVYMSSAEVYGRPTTQRVAEDHPLRPLSPYGMAKADAERTVTASGQSGGRTSTILRPFSVYGPATSERSLVGSVLAQAAGGGPIVVADRRPVRDFVFVNDVADAVVLACARTAYGCSAFNVGSGVGTSVAEIADLIAASMPARPRVVEDTARRRPEADEIFSLVADVTQSANTLGWTARTPLDAGVLISVAWARRFKPTPNPR